MELTEARTLLNSPIWPYVRDIFIATGELKVYPSGDLRRIEYLPQETQQQIHLWMEAIEKAPEWKKIIDGPTVRQLKEQYPGIYPNVFRYTAYFNGKKDILPLLLKLLFPDAYRLCFC